MGDKNKNTRSSMGDKKPLAKSYTDLFFGDKFRQRMVNAVYPYGYIPNPVRFARSFANERSKETSVTLDLKNNKYSRNRYDALQMYADLPQKFNTFMPSTHLPSSGYKDYDMAYTFSKDEDRIKYLKLAASYGLLDKDPTAPLENRQVNFTDQGTDGGNSVMNTGTLGLGKDEKGEYISFSDEWDLAGKDDAQLMQLLGPIGHIGKHMLKNTFGRPFLIYDKMYVTPEQKAKLRTIGKKVPHITNSDFQDTESKKKNTDQLEELYKEIMKYNKQLNIPANIKEMKNELKNLMSGDTSSIEWEKQFDKLNNRLNSFV